MKATAVASAKPTPSPAETESSPDPSYVLEDQVGHLLRRAHQRHTAIFQDGIGESQLTPTQFAALVKIGDLGQVSQNHLGRLTAMDPATIQGVIQRLRLRGLIERRPDRSDRRCTVLTLSAAGRTTLAAAIARGRVITDETLAPLSEAERSAFLALLRRLA